MKFDEIKFLKDRTMNPDWKILDILRAEIERYRKVLQSKIKHLLLSINIVVLLVIDDEKNWNESNTINVADATCENEYTKYMTNFL